MLKPSWWLFPLDLWPVQCTLTPGTGRWTCSPAAARTSSAMDQPIDVQERFLSALQPADALEPDNPPDCTRRVKIRWELRRHWVTPPHPRFSVLLFRSDIHMHPGDDSWSHSRWNAWWSSPSERPNSPECVWCLVLWSRTMFAALVPPQAFLHGDFWMFWTRQHGHFSACWWQIWTVSVCVTEGWGE